MTIKPIRNDNEFQAALDRISALWGAPEGTDDSDEIEVLSLLVQKYEDEHYPMPPSDPIEAIRFRMIRRLHDGLRIPYESLLGAVN